MRKKIICITGTRAEYGVLQELLSKIDSNNDFDLSLIVTGMHLMNKYGSTINEIEKDGFKIASKVDINLEDNTNCCMSKSIGYGIIGMTDALKNINPDLVIVTGDRGEMLAGAIAAAHLNIKVAHISGGDMTTGATIDERIRHAITKFSDIHLASSEESAKNLIRMGENPKNVFPVGNPGIPVTYKIDDNSKINIAEKYNLNLTNPIILVIQHPTTTQTERSGLQMCETMEAIKKLELQTIIIYPNSDAGSEEIINVINNYNYLDFVQSHKNIDRNDFKNIMALADVMVGNSSCALLEAPSFNLPAINIGNRQEGREHTSNVIHVDYDKIQIIEAIKKALTPEFKEQTIKSLSPYAINNAEENIIKILKEI
ncbi:MAG: UDP-N-acetylglucosamine 2-epimerase [Nanoarchaeota archaeon]|nr:UDP-N-acetylglucosamine 2-epimerase (hydrolyzing) [Nanoarchaeota archaeon]